MLLCDRCHRHVRDTRCPFCGATVRAESEVPGGRALHVGMLRSAVLVGAVASAGTSSLEGCVRLVSSSERAVDAQPATFFMPYGVPVPQGPAVGSEPPGAQPPPLGVRAQQPPTPTPEEPDAGAARLPPQGLVHPYGVPIPRDRNRR